jgi:hypothetical protein
MNTSKKFCPDPSLVIMLIFSFGVIMAVMLLLLALVAAAYLLNVTVSALSETVSTLHLLYGRSDSLTQLLLLTIIGYCVVRAGRSAIRSLSK